MRIRVLAMGANLVERGWWNMQQGVSELRRLSRVCDSNPPAISAATGNSAVPPRYRMLLKAAGKRCHGENQNATLV